MLSRFTKQLLPLLVPAAFLSMIPTASAASVGYFQTNLTSDIPGLAHNTDPLLKNPWGMSFGLNSPFWISDQVTNVSTLYNAAGAPQALVVATPGGPTGQVFAGGLGFTMSPGVNANFIFSTLSGSIEAWNSGTAAVTEFTATDGAVYTGLAQAGSLLYAADTRNGKIDVFNTAFQKIAASGFTDANVTAGFTPYDIQNVGGKLYVEYANRTLPGGFIAVFDASGNLLQHISDTHLNHPWGVAMAPAGFGQFGGDLLVGNFGDGMINAFNPLSGAFIGTLSDASGRPIVNSGLWAIQFRAPGSTGGDPNTLFFAAGINAEADGLFGSIQANPNVPEPATLGTMVLALAVGACAVLRRRPLSQPKAD